MAKDDRDHRTKEKVKKRLTEVERLYGKVPLVAQVLSERPDIFLAYFDYSEVTMHRPRHLDRKTAELAAVAAGSALASQHCLGVHLEAAFKAKASKDEVLEAIMLGSFLAMTRSQSVSLRMFEELKGRCFTEEENEE